MYNTSPYQPEGLTSCFKQCVMKTPFPNEQVEKVQKTMYRMGNHVADLVFRGLAVALDLPEDYFYDLHKCKGLMRTLFYPEVDLSRADKTEMRLAAHTDTPSITLLLTDEEEGLELKRPNGEWISLIASNPRGYFVNLADTMVRFSNKKVSRYESVFRFCFRFVNIRCGLVALFCSQGGLAKEYLSCP